MMPSPSSLSQIQMVFEDGEIFSAPFCGTVDMFTKTQLPFINGVYFSCDRTIRININKSDFNVLYDYIKNNCTTLIKQF